MDRRLAVCDAARIRNPPFAPRRIHHAFPFPVVDAVHGVLVDARAGGIAARAAADPRPVVEAEDEVYTFESADNGAGPSWCHGSTCLVRIGDDVFATGLETLKDAKPLNNCRWMLFHRDASGWQTARISMRTIARANRCPWPRLPAARCLFRQTRRC